MIAKRLLPLRRSLGKPESRNSWLRPFHHVSGEFVTRDPGSLRLVAEVIPMIVGEPEEAYVMVPTAIGQAMQAACGDDKLTRKYPTMDRIPLIFHHKTSHFALPNLLYPRLIVPQDLRGPEDGNATSPATLWLFGTTHSIALDETADAEFVQESYESHLQLERVSENLKDR
ncbi:hypothetical protein F5Y10DRAFT_147323 [Nemania abortiva]|nr:hypothetical protein F5Y10DRAFT_147323 [Nemania abortiva]